MVISDYQRLVAIVFDATDVDNKVAEYYDSEGRLVKGKKLLLGEVKSFFGDILDFVLFIDIDKPMSAELMKDGYQECHRHGLDSSLSELRQCK